MEKPGQMNTFWKWLAADLDRVCREAINNPARVHAGAYPASMMTDKLVELKILRKNDGFGCLQWRQDCLQWRQDNIKRIKREIRAACKRNNCHTFECGYLVFIPN